MICFRGELSATKYLSTESRKLPTRCLNEMNATGWVLSSVYIRGSSPHKKAINENMNDDLHDLFWEWEAYDRSVLRIGLESTGVGRDNFCRSTSHVTVTRLTIPFCFEISFCCVANAEWGGTWE